MRFGVYDLLACIDALYCYGVVWFGVLLGWVFGILFVFRIVVWLVIDLGWFVCLLCVLGPHVVCKGACFRFVIWGLVVCCKCTDGQLVLLAWVDFLLGSLLFAFVKAMNLCLFDCCCELGLYVWCEMWL